MGLTRNGKRVVETNGTEDRVLRNAGKMIMTVFAGTVLSWLATDTETIVVASQPFSLPTVDAKPDRRSLTIVLQSLTVFGIAGYNEIHKPLIGRKVRFALEGSRNFRAPSERRSG